MKQMKSVRTIMGLWDLHYPRYHKPTFDIFMQFAKDFRPDILILGGDNMNCGSVSSHRPPAKEQLESPTDKERKGFDRDIVGPLEHIHGGKTEKIIFDGNHEMWLYDFMDKNPGIGGELDYIKRLNLKERGWQHIAYKKYWNCGKLSFHHGDWRHSRKGAAYGAKHHAMKALEMSGRSVRYGHIHNPQMFTSIKLAKAGAPMTAMSLPCACELDQGYLEGGQTAWINGFYLGFIHDNGDFSDYMILVIKNRTVYAGKVYEAFK